MKSRIAWIPTEEAIRLGTDLGLSETQATRGAFRMMANNPELAAKVYGLLMMLVTHNKMPLRLRELIVLRIAWTTGSEYEWFQHYLIATTEAGLTEQDVLAVRHWNTSDRLGPGDQAVLAAVDDTIREGKISDAVWDECARYMREPAVLVEMVIAIGTWIMFSQIFQSLEVPLQQGASSWPPDGNAPVCRRMRHQGCS